MNIHPMIEKLKKLKLKGMVESLEDQLKNETAKELLFEERLGILIENELVLRENKRLNTRLKKAELKQGACMQDVDYRSNRNLDKALFMSFENCHWIKNHKNILITGPTGTGKSYLGESLTHNACMKEVPSKMIKLSHFFEKLTAAKADGKYLKILAELSKYELIFFDDFGMDTLSIESAKDFWKIVDDRYNRRSMVIVSQLPVKLWHSAIGDEALADAILDRIVHNAYKIELSENSLRRKSKPDSSEENS